MPRISQTTLRRLDRLDAPLRERRQRASFVYALAHGIDSLPASIQSQLSRAQRTLLSWPPIATDAAAWEADAAKHQDSLIDSSSEDRAKHETAVTSPPVPTNNNTDHNAASRAAGDARRQGGRPYLEDKERLVRQMTL